ncbi:MAG TPA: CdaR family protein [Candidatus Limnocylindrales bacterium]|nr:CdaR family protein [Candidatus Limnocylindrales bacterium]
MRRVLGFVVRNWPLKLGAIVLASVLYGGLVLGQNARVWPVQVPIQVLDQPSGTFDLTGAQYVTAIRLYASPDVASQLTSSDFTATIDLANVVAQPGGSPAVVPVDVKAHDPRVTILDFKPRQISIRLDPIVSKPVPVAVDRGEIPTGLTIGQPDVDVSQVTVRGGSTLVDRVARAEARVRIDPSGINVDGEVDLVAVDQRGDLVSPVDLSPASAHVRIAVDRATATRSLPVVATVSGNPAPGYAIRSVTVQPAVVAVSGSAQAIGDLQSLVTAPISVTGRTSDLKATVALAPPDGVTIQGAGTVSVTIDVAALSGTQTFQVGLVLSGAAAERTYSLATQDVTVTLSGPLPALLDVVGSRITASLDVAGLGLGSHSVAVAVSAPAGTTLASLTPTRVTVVVGAQATPSPSPSPSSQSP